MHKRSRDRGVRTPCGTYYGVAPGHRTRSTDKRSYSEKGRVEKLEFVCDWLGACRPIIGPLVPVARHYELRPITKTIVVLEL